MNRRLLSLGAAALLALAPTGVRAEALAFPDVPRSHWAHDAVKELAELGILRGDGRAFRGTARVNRYQMAVILDRTLKEIKKRRPAAGPLDPEARKALEGLETLMIELADELADLTVRLDQMQVARDELAGELDRLADR